MKKVVSCIFAVLFLLSGCQKEAGNLSSETSPTARLAAVTADVGKTLDDLRAQHPDYGYLHLDGYDFSAEGLGLPDGDIAYVFFGTQSGLSLEEIAPEYGKELKCAGIYTTVDKVFSVVKDEPVSVEEFLSSVGLDINNADRVNFWAGWIFFDYGNYSMAINTNDAGNADSEVGDVPDTEIEGRFSLLIIDENYWSSNGKLCAEIENAGYGSTGF